MANYPKSFNFRNGLQVDNDNFVVNSAGLVGIGTSSPQAPNKLDVHGGARILGLATVTTLGVTGVSTFYDDLKVGNSISFDASAGQINATNVVANTFNGGIIVAIATAGWTFEHGGAGISTFISVGIGTTSDTNYDLRIGSGISFTGNTGSAFYSGVVTATTFDGNLDAADLSTGTIPDARFPATLPTSSGASLTNLNASNISSGTIDAARVPTLNQNTTGTAAGLSGSPNTVLGVTTTGSLSATSIGIGTNAPTTDLQIKKESGNATLEVISDTGRSSISIGNSVGAGNSSASINYGSTNGFGNFSTLKSFDIINRDTGYINYFLSNNATNSAFVWHKGPSNQLMSLTHDGNLGIGITNPTHKLDVQGISTFTGNAHFTSNVTIGGNLEIDLGGTFSINGNISAASFKGDILAPDGIATIIDTGSGNGSNGLSFVNTNVTTGVSTFNNIKQNNNAYAVFATDDLLGFDGIGGNQPKFAINPPTLVGGTGCPRFVVTQKGCVGVGTTNPKCALDLSNATADDAAVSYSSDRFMIFPRVSTSDRGNLTDLVGGAVIYNTTVNRLELYNGTGWVGIVTEA